MKKSKVEPINPMTINNKTFEIWNKLLRGNDQRISRLHDRQDHFVSPTRLLLNGTRALLSYLSLTFFQYRHPTLWISYTATMAIEKKLSKKKSTVLEFGSGLSTLWFAKRASHVFSIEHDSQWFDRVQNELTKSQYDSIIQTKLATTCEEYSHFKSHSNKQFDVILVDGPWRAECLKQHMHLVKQGGIIYLDNSDAESSSGESGEIALAVKRLFDFAKKQGATIERYTDFAPSCLFVSQGLLLRMPV